MFRLIKNPVYSVTCARCGDKDEVADQYEAHLKGYAEVTISQRCQLTNTVVGNKSRIVWLCVDCHEIFERVLKPFENSNKQ